MNELLYVLVGAAASAAIASVMRSAGTSRRVEQHDVEITLAKLNAAELKGEVGRHDEQLKYLKEQLDVLVRSS